MSSKAKIVSFNIRYTFDGDGINSFLHRVGMIIDKIQHEKPDVVCFQEATTRMRPILDAGLNDYNIIYAARHADFYGEGIAIAYRKETIDLHCIDRFWLSETPYVPDTRYPEQSTIPRVCQDALLLHKESRKLFRVYNNHLDHAKPEGRLVGLKQVLNRVAEDNKAYPCPIVVLGDFNAKPEDIVIDYCNKFENGMLTDITADIGGTFHNFGELENPRKIDYIYVDKSTAKKEHSVELWDDTINGIFLSDHYPVSAVFEL